MMMVMTGGGCNGDDDDDEGDGGIDNDNSGVPKEGQDKHNTRSIVLFFEKSPRSASEDLGYVSKNGHKKQRTNVIMRYQKCGHKKQRAQVLIYKNRPCEQGNANNNKQ